MDKIISKLEYFDRKFPRKELEEAIKRRDEITPILLDALDGIVENPEKIADKDEYMLHLYGMYLLAQFREKKAFTKIVDLVSLPPEEVEYYLGDTMTEGLSSIMYSTYDGQLPALQSVIENPLINIYVRGAALDVFGKLYSDGAFSKEYLVEYLRELIDDIPYDWETDLATDIQGVVVDYHILGMIDNIQYLYDEGRIDRSMHGDYDSFIDWIYSYEYENPSVKYIDDVIEEMQWWACFDNSNEQKRDKKKAFDEMEKLIKKLNKDVQKLRGGKIGRNDPCPCGSGKKYKRCCIDKPVDSAGEGSIESEEERARWLQDYPNEGGERQEGQVYIGDFYDQESIDIDKFVYLALHKRAIPMWVKRDRLKENKNKIAYLTEASNLFLTKCNKEGITSFEDYDAKYKIHYRSKDWFKAFEELLVENKKEYGSILKRVRDAISTFS